MSQPIQERCGSCGSTEIRYDTKRAESFCGDCGTLINQSSSKITTDIEYNQGNDTRYGNSKGKRKDTRPKPASSITTHHKGLPTTFDTYSGLHKNMDRWNRMEKLNQQCQQLDDERRVAYALSEIDRICSNMHIPRSIQEEACYLFKRANEIDDFLVSNNIGPTVGASIFIATKMHNVPRQAKEISKLLKYDRYEIVQTAKNLEKELKITQKPVTPDMLVPVVGDKVEAPMNIQAKAERIIENVPNHELSGKSPLGLAASAIYAAIETSEHDMTQREISETVDTNVKSLQKHLKVLREVRDEQLEQRM